MFSEAPGSLRSEVSSLMKLGTGSSPSRRRTGLLHMGRCHSACCVCPWPGLPSWGGDERFCKNPPEVYETGNVGFSLGRPLWSFSI